MSDSISIIEPSSNTLDLHHLIWCLEYCTEYIEKKTFQALEEPKHKQTKIGKNRDPRSSKNSSLAGAEVYMRGLKKCTIVGLKGICRITPASTEIIITHEPLLVGGIFPTVKDVLWF